MEKEKRYQLAEEECRKAFLESKKKFDMLTEKYKDEPGIDKHSDEYKKVKEEFFTKQREINKKYGIIWEHFYQKNI